MAAYTCIRKGSNGSLVVVIQTQLQGRGYGPCISQPDGTLECDWDWGVFDDAVEAAVKEFQVDEGLVSQRHPRGDGIVGPDTWVAFGMARSDTTACGSGVWETITSTLLPDTVADADVPEGVEMKLWDHTWFWPAVAVGAVGIGVVIYRGQK